MWTWVETSLIPQTVKARGRRTTLGRLGGVENEPCLDLLIVRVGLANYTVDRVPEVR